MAVQAKRATVYLDPELHKALRLKAVETSRSVSELVNEAVKEALADVNDNLKMTHCDHRKVTHPCFSSFLCLL
jgi:predicted DNA-binding protein